MNSVLVYLTRGDCPHSGCLAPSGQPAFLIGSEHMSGQLRLSPQGRALSPSKGHASCCVTVSPWRRTLGTTS